MTTATVETNERRISVEEQARIVSNLLKEYAGKLAALNADLLGAVSNLSQTATPALALLLDQGELLRPPLSQIISRGSGLLEHANLDSLTEDELVLRMREIEIHLHHTLRLTHELRQATENAHKSEKVTKLRVSAGLNAMKGGPLRPNE
jgi:hypothetical protein